MYFIIFEHSAGLSGSGIHFIIEANRFYKTEEQTKEKKVLSKNLTIKIVWIANNPFSKHSKLYVEELLDPHLSPLKLQVYVVFLNFHIFFFSFEFHPRQSHFWFLYLFEKCLENCYTVLLLTHKNNKFQSSEKDVRKWY